MCLGLNHFLDTFVFTFSRMKRAQHEPLAGTVSIAIETAQTRVSNNNFLHKTYFFLSQNIRTIKHFR